MKNGYKLLWSERSLSDLRLIISYLEERWSHKEIQKFARRLDKRLELITINPLLFPKTGKRRSIRRSVLTKHTVIYYELSGKLIRIVTLFDPRQDPDKLKM